jgi:hypothetical protein
VIRPNRNRFVNLGSMTLALLVTVLLVTGGASAKERKAKASDSQARVVAHISFSGLSAVDMAMQKKVKDKYYLYVQHSKDQGVSIIDISKPDQPKAVGVVPWPDPAASSRMNVTGDLAIIAESDVQRRSSSNDDLILWDLSNPAVPRVVQKFEGVVRWFQDERNYVYVLNGEGLWVVSEPTDRQQQEESDPSSNYGG